MKHKLRDKIINLGPKWSSLRILDDEVIKTHEKV